MLTPLTPGTMKTSMEMLVPCVALTMPTFPSNSPFTAAATSSFCANDASYTEIIMALGPLTKLDVAAGNNALALVLATIGARGEGLGPQRSP